MLSVARLPSTLVWGWGFRLAYSLLISTTKSVLDTKNILFIFPPSIIMEASEIYQGNIYKSLLIYKSFTRFVKEQSEALIYGKISLTKE